MSDLPLGQLIDETQQRDAIHIAVAPVTAAERLVPGGHVGFVNGDRERVTARATTLIGIVDPFLTAIVEHGQRFWLFLYPQTITSLRHDWTHPAFEAAPAASAPDEAASERFLREYADLAGLSLETLLASARNRLSGGGGVNIHTDIPDEAFEKRAEFWHHFAIVTGETVETADTDRIPFYCGC